MTVDRDNVFFKRLLDLVPAQVYFSEDMKNQIRSKVAEQDGDARHEPPSKKAKNHKSANNQPITDLQATQNGEDGEARNEQPSKKAKKHKRADPINNQPVTKLQAVLNAMDDKIKAKKASKRKKKKEKPAGLKADVQEVQEKLKQRLEELQAKRAEALSEAEKQEQKRLRRKQKKLSSKARKQKKPKTKTDEVVNASEASSVTPSSQTQKDLGGLSSKQEEKVVFSKFVCSESGKEKDPRKSKLVGRDYKRLLQKLEQRNEKIAKVSKKDPSAAAKLEQKYVWQDVLSKARGEKVKDDPTLLKKALKRKEKIQAIHKKKWEDRQKTVQKQQKERQDKRDKNIQARKDAKKEKKRKKLIKKGRLIPGL